MRLLITGSGFLGTNLYQWIRRNHPEIEVTIVSRRTGTDIRDYEQIKKVIKGNDLVCHTAAQTHVDYSLHNDLEDQLNFVDTNVKGTLHVIKACERYGAKMIYVSTSEIYGQNQNPGKPMTESHPIDPQAGIYAVTKAAPGEMKRALAPNQQKPKKKKKKKMCIVSPVFFSAGRKKKKGGTERKYFFFFCFLPPRGKILTPRS